MGKLRIIVVAYVPNDRGVVRRSHTQTQIMDRVAIMDGETCHGIAIRRVRLMQHTIARCRIL